MKPKLVLSHIIMPFFLTKINGLAIDEKIEADIYDFQDELGLADDEIEKIANGKSYTNYHLYTLNSSKEVFTLDDDAELGYIENGLFSAHDIFGNEIEINIEYHPLTNIDEDTILENFKIINKD